MFATSIGTFHHARDIQRNQIFIRLLAVLLIVGASTFVYSSRADAVAFCSWTGNGTTNNWSDAGNWSSCNGNIPLDGDVLDFGDGASRKTNVNDIVGLQLARIVIGGSNYNISGNQVEITTLEGNTVFIPGSNNYISLDLLINVSLASQIISFNDNEVASDIELNVTGSNIFYVGALLNRTLTMSGQISGTAAMVYPNSQAGTVIYTGDSSYTSTNVNMQSANAVVCQSATCFGSTDNVVQASNNSNLTISTPTFAYDMVVSDTGGTTPIESTESVAMAGDITVNGETVFDAAVGETFTFSGAITGPGCITSSDSIFSGAQLSFSLTGGSGCTSYTQLNSSGPIDLSNVELVFPTTISYDPTDGEVLTIVTASDVSGEFIDVEDGSLLSATFSGNARYFQINYSDTEVTLTKLSDQDALEILTPPTTVPEVVAAPGSVGSTSASGDLPVTGASLPLILFISTGLLGAGMFLITMRRTFSR